MGLIEKLFGGKKPKIELSEKEVIEAGACPNCWGKQEYEGQYIEYLQDQTKSNINNDKSNQKAFVTQFVETHLTGIRLKKDGDKLVCPTCTFKTKHVSSKAS